MKVWVVSYGWDYEGEDEKSLRVFAREEDAVAYRDQWNADVCSVRAYSTYDYALMLEREVQ